MTRDEALAQLYGSNPQMKTVLEQRCAIAREARDMIQRLQRRMHQEFPPIDSIGARLESLFSGDVAVLDYQIKDIERAIVESERATPLPRPSKLPPNRNIREGARPRSRGK